MPESDKDEGFKEERRPRAQRRPSSDDDAIQDKPRRQAPSRREGDQEDDERFDDRPRRRRPGSDDALTSIIPIHNGMALASYYCGVFGLIPVIGFVLGPLAILFGVLGLRHVGRRPEAKGTGHSITGIVLGSLTTLGHLFVLMLILFSAAARG